MMRRALQGLLLAAAILSFRIPQAHATSLAAFTQDQMVDASTYIVRGKVVDVWTEEDDHGTVWTRAGVEVSRTLKGPDNPDYLVVDAHGGAVGDLTERVPSAARFAEGEDVLLFLTPIDFGRRLTPVGMFLGKFTIRRAPGDTRKIAQRFTSTDPTYRPQFLPYPKQADRVYVNDLVGQVEHRLAQGWDGKTFPGLTDAQLRVINTPERRKVR